MTDKKRVEQWVHVKITDRELAEQLEAMIDPNTSDRSKFLRGLIRDEWNRRNVRVEVGEVVKLVKAEVK